MFNPRDLPEDGEMVFSENWQRELVELWDDSQIMCVSTDLFNDDPIFGD